MELINLYANLRGLIAWGLQIAMDNPHVVIIFLFIMFIIWFPKGTAFPVIYRSFDRRKRI